jgi:uncharacterized protein YbjQ (UPF0145 family)
MSSNKKDLTRIEDLGEFIHELNVENDFESTDQFSTELPDLPAEDMGFDSPPEFESSPADDNSFPATSFSSEETTEFNQDHVDFSDRFDDSSSNQTPDEFTEPKPELEPKNDTEPSFDSNQFTPEEESDVRSDSEDIKPSVHQGVNEKGHHKSFSIDESHAEIPENFKDIKTFTESSSFSAAPIEGNPSFSLLIKNVRFLEDINDIISLLREFSLLADGEDQTKDRLMRGTLLVPRISEFSAILLAHKLRKLDIDIQVGLSDEIHPPKHQHPPEIGIVSRHSLYQNQGHHFQFTDSRVEISQIIISSTPQLEGHQIVRYLGVASEHKMLEAQMVEDGPSAESSIHYQELAQKMKAHALKANSNAVVGLNYQLTPIPSEYGINRPRYRLTCTGNLVWVNKL